MSKDTAILPDSPLDRVLSADKVPVLPSDFGDRIVARTKDRPGPLPGTRPIGGSGRWRTSRRLAVGAVMAGALATAAAATGLLDNLPISIPSAEKVWATITGQDAGPDPIVPTPASEPDQLVPETSAPVTLEGPIDSPEELEEAFRRVDELRTNRASNRRDRVDQRIDKVLDRRREQGLPAPTPEQESRLRERLERNRERRDGRRDDRIEERREELREQLTREDFIREQRDAARPLGQRDRFQRLRDLSPEERRERIRQFREQRQLRRLRREQEDGVVKPPLDEADAVIPDVDPPQSNVSPEDESE